MNEGMTISQIKTIDLPKQRVFIDTFEGGTVDIEQIVEVYPYKQWRWNLKNPCTPTGDYCTVCRLLNNTEACIKMEVAEVIQMLRSYYNPPIGVIVNEHENR